MRVCVVGPVRTTRHTEHRSERKREREQSDNAEEVVKHDRCLFKKRVLS